MLPHAPPDTPARMPRVVAVACSGGRDSTALLHATLQAAHTLGLEVVALHVHHGLNPQADGWLDHLQTQVAQWRDQGLPVRLAWERLSGAPSPGDSIEAWARTGRHEALHRMAGAAGADLLLLAHHRRDQAETFLLQALRGAGMAGLAAMPRQQWREGLCWARPWLDQPREAVEAYVRLHGLTHIEDDSNANPRFARNRLRMGLWPVLTEAAPSAEAALAQSAAWAQEALALQQEMAALDMAAWTGGGPGLGEDRSLAPPAQRSQAANGSQSSPQDQGRELDVGAWKALSPARLSNLLRTWLRQCAGRAAPASLIARLLREVPAATVGQWPFGPEAVWLYRGRLLLSRTSPARTEASSMTLDLSTPGWHPVPQWHGAFEVFEVSDATVCGVSASRLNKVELRPREGGVRFQAHALGIPRSLKKCWQSAGIPAPQREGPLAHMGGTLLYVPGLGIDARVAESPAKGLLALRWRQDAC